MARLKTDSLASADMPSSPVTTAVQNYHRLSTDFTAHAASLKKMTADNSTTGFL